MPLDVKQMQRVEDVHAQRCHRVLACGAVFRLALVDIDGQLRTRALSTVSAEGSLRLLVPDVEFDMAACGLAMQQELRKYV